MTEWLAVITITTLAVISPGPDFIMTSRNALTLSRRAGLLTALGIGAGVLVHVCYTLFGIELLMSQSPALLELLKLAGATYLIWLGAKMLIAHNPDKIKPNTQQATTDFSATRTGFLTNALNPKTAIFIISLFMQIVGPDTSIEIRIIYGAFISLTHVIWFSAVSLLFSEPIFQKKILGVRRWIDGIFGIILIGFGTSLAFTNLSF
jgi:RhtB (resistance to homoserine/threonine) family protein